VIGALALVLWRPVPAWPDAEVRVRMLRPDPPPGFRRHRVTIDPGHGARDNTGNRSAYCVLEQDFTLELSELVMQRLQQTGHFEVALTRHRGEVVEYADRVARAEAWRAEAWISLHSDVRGRASEWEPSPGSMCQRSRSEPGYAVIYSDDAGPELVERRRSLALEIGASLKAAGLHTYAGRGYALDYQLESGERAVFVDRRSPGSRIFVLHRPRMPSVLIETHNALHDREVVRWDEPETREAFAQALVAALYSAFSTSPRDRRKAEL
jgi:N-acetylmuramoyl-L-alanine amidase